MRCRCFSLLLVTLPLFAFTAGCHYIHFGRLDRIRNDSALAAENSDLRIEKKLLKEELEIARKEREILGAAVERSAGGNSPPTEEFVAKLASTNRELVALRESYARLKDDREQLKPTPLVHRIFRPVEAPPNQQIAGLKEQLGKTEEKLADALRTNTELQGDNSRLRAEIEKVHAENASLATKVEQMSADASKARAALAQLNTVLLAQKAARTEAEQNTASAAPAPTPTPPAVETAKEPALSLASARESSADAAREIAVTLHSGAFASSSTAVVRATQPEALAPAPATAEPAAAVTPSVETYTVREGDSLEKIAEQVYGRRDRWIKLYAANNALLSEGRPLKAGMTLQVPKD